MDDWCHGEGTLMANSQHFPPQIMTATEHSSENTSYKIYLCIIINLGIISEHIYLELILVPTLFTTYLIKNEILKLHQQSGHWCWQRLWSTSSWILNPRVQFTNLWVYYTKPWVLIVFPKMENLKVPERFCQINDYKILYIFIMYLNIM